MLKLNSVIVIAALMSPVLASADPCDKDRVTTCGDTTAGDGHVFDCMMGRSDKVAPACASALGRAQQLADAVLYSCRDDAQKFCAQYANTGRSAVVECLKSHKDKLQESCRKSYRQFKAFGFDIKS